MTRRSAILAVLALPLGYFRAFAAEAGWLTVDLGQWAGIKVRLAGKEVVITNVDIFKALQADCRLTGDCKREEN
jgi:hypothetical protein